MPEPTLQFQLAEHLKHLKTLAAIVFFVFSLGVGYQSLRLEDQIAAQDKVIHERVTQHELRGDMDREYIQKDLAEIKAQLAEIQRYLREKK